MPDKRCWYSETKPQELGIALAFNWLAQRKPTINGVILAAVTNGVLERALSEVIDQRAAKRIVAGEIARIFDIPLTVVTQKKKFWGRGSNRVVLALYPDRRLMDELDSIPEVSDLIVVVWSPRDIEDWKRARSPTSLGSTSAPAEATLTQSVVMSKIVKEALKDLTGRVNLSTGLAHPSDRSAAIRMFEILKNAGEPFTPEEVKAWLTGKGGWKATHAQEAAEVAKKILEGRKLRHDQRCWADNILDQWRERASSNPE